MLKNILDHLQNFKFNVYSDSEKHCDLLRLQSRVFSLFYIKLIKLIRLLCV